MTSLPLVIVLRAQREHKSYIIEYWLPGTLIIYSQYLFSKRGHCESKSCGSHKYIILFFLKQIAGEERLVLHDQERTKTALGKILTRKSQQAQRVNDIWFVLQREKSRVFQVDVKNNGGFQRGF